MEHLAHIDISSAGTVKFAIPKGGVIYGVYADQNINIGYDDNGNVGTLKTAVKEWEPTPAFQPAPIAYLVLTATVATTVNIRYEV